MGGIDVGWVYKFVIVVDGSVLEVGGVNGIFWYLGVIGVSELLSLYGLGVDRNGLLYIGFSFGLLNNIWWLDC